MHEASAIKALSDDWKRAGIHEGDTVLIQSDITRTMRRLIKRGFKATPQNILDSFLNTVTQNGTLIFPLFNFSFPVTKHFDIRNTPSQMGALTEAARRYPGAVRTGHPIYSFMVIGKQAKLFEGVDNVS